MNPAIRPMRWVDRALRRFGLERIANSPIKELTVTWHSPQGWSDGSGTPPTNCKPPYVDLKLSHGQNVTGWVYPKLQVGWID